jgi:hypothetical protein
MADGGYQDYSDRTSGGGSLKQAAQDAPLVGTAMSAYQDATSGDIGSLGADIGNFVMGAQSVMEDPLNALISAGLNFLMDVIQPLRDCLQKVTGDAGALDDTKETFTDIGKDIDNLASELDQITRTGFQNWSGPAKDAAGQKVATFVQGVQGTAGNAGDVAQVLSLSAMLMEGAYNLVMGIISDLIEWLVVTWLAALAAEAPTFGGSTAAAGAATTAEVGVEGASAADKVEQATSLVDRISSVFEKIVGQLKNLGKDVGDVDKAVSDGDKALTDGDKALSDGDKTLGDSDKGGETTPSDSSSDTDTDSGGGGGDGPGKDTRVPDKIRGKTEESGSGGGESGEGNQNWAQRQWSETRKNWNEITNPKESTTFRQYMTEHEKKPDGSSAPNRVQELFLDPLKEDALKLTGQLVDPSDSSAGQSDQQIDQELRG